ncbi:MAG: lipoate--protein ligase family protein [Proteobacteria bacterium]|nr:lipoate--protein ligase family protein [Pseudomonadota bacterium]
MQLLDFGFAGRAAFDAAYSRALLELVATGAAPETFRLYQPDDVLAFSSVDAASAGFAAAVAAARAAGFEPALRLAGGRAAVFHRETLAFAWTIPAAESRDGIHARFGQISEIVAAALRRLGVDARIGEVPGEYCPGEYSVNARGARKLMGVGQRVIRGAAHVGGVIVVRDSDRVSKALGPVYDAMQLEWDPETAGSVEDELGVATRAEVAAALLVELRSRIAIEAGDGFPLDAAFARATALEARFMIESA